MDPNPVLMEQRNLESRSIQFYINQRQRNHTSLLKYTQLMVFNSCLWCMCDFSINQQKIKLKKKKKKWHIQNVQLANEIKIYKCCQMFSFFFFLRTDRKTFILSTAWDIKSCNIQRFIEVIGVWFFWLFLFFWQTGQTRSCNVWQIFMLPSREEIM